MQNKRERERERERERKRGEGIDCFVSELCILNARDLHAE